MRSLTAAGGTPPLWGLISSMPRLAAMTQRGGRLADLLQRCSAALLQGGSLTGGAPPKWATPQHGSCSAAHSVCSAAPAAGWARQAPTQPARTAGGDGSGDCGDAIPDVPQAGGAAAGAPFVEHRRRQGRRIVAAAISGGVDSAVAASMLQQQGHEVSTHASCSEAGSRAVTGFKPAMLVCCICHVERGQMLSRGSLRQLVLALRPSRLASLVCRCWASSCATGTRPRSRATRTAPLNATSRCS